MNTRKETYPDVAAIDEAITHVNARIDSLPKVGLLDLSEDAKKIKAQKLQLVNARDLLYQASNLLLFGFDCTD